MKKAITLGVSIFLFCACVTSNAVKTDKSAIKKEVNTLLVNWHKAASDANFKEYFRVLDSTTVYIGTAAEEIWTKEQFANFSKPYFDKGKAWSFTTLERNIYMSESANIVWFDELIDTWMGTCRGSGVLEKKEDSWKIKQYVLSVAIPNDDIQAVIDIKKKNDAIFLKRY
ncbi:MAG: nuclear transport factor 2 family protein [Polaribacter sp.]|jgi:hypothetical protein|uniref:nuclear transport factor 2 family protein n=1 Tax=uncultured Polaribacter sp. TaxID=174711 RepID=UPI0030D7D566|tara:strand:- start:1362 stop:1871 length:510 start_codon:yes stop_codon:yes gene_type:complete